MERERLLDKTTHIPYKRPKRYKKCEGLRSGLLHLKAVEQKQAATSEHAVLTCQGA